MSLHFTPAGAPVSVILGTRCQNNSKVFDWIEDSDLATMAGEEEKNKRRSALSNFTRNLNTLTSLLEDNSPPLLVNPQYDKFKDC